MGAQGTWYADYPRLLRLMTPSVAMSMRSFFCFLCAVWRVDTDINTHNTACAPFGWWASPSLRRQSRFSSDTWKQWACGSLLSQTSADLLGYRAILHPGYYQRMYNGKLSRGGASELNVPDERGARGRWLLDASPQSKAHTERDVTSPAQEGRCGSGRPHTAQRARAADVGSTSALLGSDLIRGFV